jgi:hypothetical protein
LNPCRAVLLLPDLQDTDLGAGGLAVGLALGLPEVAHDRGIADHGYGDLGKGDRLNDRLPGHDALDELGFRLDLAARMAVAKCPSGNYRIDL